MKHREIIKLLETGGRFHVRTSGVTPIYRHNEKPGIVVVPIHSRDLAKGIAAAILKQAGIQR